MNCPKCGKEMIEGVLQTDGALIFDPKDKKALVDDNNATTSMFKWTKFIYLTRRKNFSVSNVKSHYCKNCEFIITNLSNK